MKAFMLLSAFCLGLMTFFLNNHSKKTPETNEIFIDSLTIGNKGKNMVDLKHFLDAESYVEIKFFSKKKNQWILKNSYRYEKDFLISCDPVLEDLNNDGYLDFTYKSDVAARGANEVRRLFLYNKKTDELVSMKNSNEFPNLMYNKKLKCLTSQMFHGGSTTVFLKIEKDSLRMFASVDNSDEQVITTYDTKGNPTEIGRKPIDPDEIYDRYDNFNPVE
ncbi:hypothetical protein H1R17_05105 [Flavobacterium sp. xlx-214]|uniref:XAC2610-related protein n=1 Tax=unclassified Flavobacterium TaxID=196869 RepID=UPI0013D44538|nr:MULTISPECIES: hypothetical protein [unclassified Flavobacterium]MBA5793580.1 hypothetical protein [Flavobacterium sp. xlx-221]QMI84510.1 hypothetical protein H1R17_05105 [Flavobacterium sp. xlx-214]